MFSQAKNQFSASVTLALALILSILVVIPLTPERATALAGDGECNLSSLGASGNGSFETPWGISTPEQLWEITDCSEGNFVLLQNINVANALAGTPTQSPIGLNGTGGNEDYSTFTGVLDGNFHTISFSMDINDGAALFHSLDKAEIRNLTLSGTIRSNPTSAKYSGGLAIDAINQNTISNVTVALDIHAKSHVGGFVGEVQSGARLTILDSKFTGTIEALGETFADGSGVSRNVGGFVARSIDSTLVISGSESLGPVSSSLVVAGSGLVSFVGGFLGRAENTSLSLTGLTRSSTVTSGGGPSQGTGGIVGNIDFGVSTISNVSNLGKIQAPNYVGGLIGIIIGRFPTSLARLELHDSKNSGSIAGQKYVGGLIGSTDNHSRVTISGAVNNGEVTATVDHSGGIVGYSNEAIHISQSENNGTISDTSTFGYAGGILGWRSSSNPNSILSVTDSTNSGRVFSSHYSGGVIGGLFGRASISGVINTGNVSTTHASAVGAGGIVGNAARPITIDDSKNFGQVNGSTHTGGFLGSVTTAVANLRISNSSNHGTVTTIKDNAGGFIGSIGGNSSFNLEGLHNSGTVSAIQFAGGFLGSIVGTTTSVRIANSTNEGNVETDQNSVGGFIGSFSEGSPVNSSLLLENLTNSGSVRSNSGSGVGGIFGFTRLGNFNLTNLSNTGTVSAQSNKSEVAGIGAFAQPTAGFFATELRNSGSVTGGSYLGGLFARVGLGVAGTHVTISDSINSGTVSGSLAFVGGIVGEVTQFASAFLNLSRVGNQAPISGTSDVGGLIGISSMSSTTIQSSFNSGEIEGSSILVGGLAGQTKGVFNVVDASSTGTIRGLGNVGGLVGIANPGANLTRVFTVATVSATFMPADGLDGGSAPPTTISAFTSTTSRYADTTELQEFYSVGLYTGWDFETVWAFGECAVLGELPVLRWANPNKTFSTTSCFVVVDLPPEESTQAGSTDSNGAVAPPTASYQGPMLRSATTIVFRGEVAELFGTKLEAVTTAELQGLTLLILAATSTSITLEIPAGADLGIHDLVLISSFGRLTVMNSLDVRARASTNQFGELLGFRWSERYAGNSRTLSQQQSDGIASALPRFSGVTTIVCWGYTTAADPNEWAIAHATQRAASVCRDIQRLQPDVQTHVRVRFGVTKSAALRASMQFWELRVAN